MAFVRRERISADGVPDGFWPGPPDLAIEIRSPGDRLTGVLEKVQEYLARGVRLVWVVDSKKQTVTVYQSHSEPKTLAAGGLLDGGDVITGFSCEIHRIFD